MRAIVVRILGTALSFYVTSLLIPGFQLESTWATYIIASFIFVLLNWIVAPIIKLLLLPINLLTLGLFRWLVNVLMLYIFDLVYPGISIKSYYFEGFNSGIIALPPGQINLFWTLVLSSLVISLTYSLVSLVLAPES